MSPLHMSPLRKSLLALLLLLALPLVILGPALFGDAVFLPFDPARFPPTATTLTQPQIDALDAHANMDVTEVPLTFEPELRFVRDELAQGRLPHWNPYARFGASLLATSVVGLLYPPNWCTLLALEPMRGFAWNAWLALALAGVLMFGFLRALGLAHAVALFGALAFAWSGTVSANLHFYQRVHALVWLPGMLWALHAMAKREGRARWQAGVGLALSLAMSWLAGFPAYAAAATLVAALFGLGLTVQTAREKGRAAALRLTRAMVTVSVLGLLLASVQLLPMFAFFPESNRNPHPSPDDIANQAFDPMGLLGYLFPHLFGSPTEAAPPARFSVLTWWMFSRASWVDGRPFEPNYNSTEYAVFPGTCVVLLAIAGAWFAQARGRVVAILALALLGWLATAGAATAWLYGLPLFESVPPMRFMGPACLLVALLAALGADAAWRGRGRWLWWLLGGVAIVGAGLAAALRISLGTWAPDAWLTHLTPDLLAHYRPRYPGVSEEIVQGMFREHVGEALARARSSLGNASLAFALAGVWLLALPWVRGFARGPALWLLVAGVATVGELLGLAGGVLSVRTLPYAGDTPILAFLREQRDASRARGGFTVIRGSEKEGQLPAALPPCLLVPERIRDLHAYTFVDAWSHRLFAELYGAAHMIRGFWPSAFPDDERLRRPLFDLLGCRFVLSADPLVHAGVRVGPQLVSPDGKRAFFVYERASALPRAFVVPALREVADDDAVVQAMVAPDLDPRAAVLVRNADAADLRRHVGAPGAEARTVRVVAETPTALSLEIDQGPAGFLVLSDSPMRGWTATVEGRDTPITRGNLCMRVLPLGADATRVEMRFATPRLPLGLGLTLLAAAALVTLAWRRPRSRPVPDLVDTN